MKTVLTVDDSPTMRSMLLRALSEAGFNVVQAADGLEGLEMIRNTRPDVVITDINMPRLDGFGFIEKVRQDADHRATPILVLTTETDNARRVRARVAGATGWITKPFDPVKLVSAINRVVA